MQTRVRRWAAWLPVAGLVLAGCGGADTAVVPGLDPADEIALVEVDPEPADESFDWTMGLQVGDLPAVSVGHPTEVFMADAHREDGDPEDLICVGSSGSIGCAPDDTAAPALHGITFGGPDVEAWAWSFVPADATVVRFTDQDGATSWQRPVDGTVVFPDTSSGNCECRLDALDEAGEVVASVDVATSSFVDP